MAHFTEKVIYAVYISFAASVVGATIALWWIWPRVLNRDEKDGLGRSQVESQSGAGSEGAWS